LKTLWEEHPVPLRVQYLQESPDTTGKCPVIPTTRKRLCNCFKRPGSQKPIRQKPLYLVYNNNEGHRLVAQSVAQQLRDIGLNVETQAMDWDSYKEELQQMNLTLFRLEWYADYPDPDSFLYSLFHSCQTGMSNFTGYFNPQVDKILDTSRAEVISHQERIKLLNRAEQIIVDDAPCLWLFQGQTAKLIGKDVKKLDIDNMGMINWGAVELKPDPAADSPGGSRRN
jgi:ABC-type transport system substrate-binding protein